MDKSRVVRSIESTGTSHQSKNQTNDIHSVNLMYVFDKSRDNAS